ARMIICKLERTAMKLGNCLHQTQTQTNSRRATTEIAAIEPLRDLGLLAIGDAGAVIGHADLDRALAERLNSNLHRAPLANILERIVDEVADGLRQQRGIP